MSKIMMVLGIISLGLFSSCDKCKKADCQNGATCEKKVGDCVCATFYDGDKCDGEVKANYVGTYKGSAKLGGFVLPTSIVVGSGSGVSALTFKATITTPSGPAEYNITATLTDNTTYTIPAQTVSFSLIAPNTSAVISGSGTLSASSATATLNFKANADGLNYTAAFTGSK